MVYVSSPLAPSLSIRTWAKRTVIRGLNSCSRLGYALNVTNGDVFAVPSTVNPLDYAALTLGVYERHESQALKHLQPASTVVELGANIGVVSSFILRKLLKPEGTLLAVEANDTVQKTFWQNVRRYKGEDQNVRLRNVAVGAPKEDRMFKPFCFLPNLSSRFADVCSAAEHQRKGSRIQTVAVESLSWVLDCEGIKARSPWWQTLKALNWLC